MYYLSTSQPQWNIWHTPRKEFRVDEIVVSKYYVFKMINHSVLVKLSSFECRWHNNIIYMLFFSWCTTLWAKHVTMQPWTPNSTMNLPSQLPSHRTLRCNLLAVTSKLLSKICMQHHARTNAILTDNFRRYKPSVKMEKSFMARSLPVENLLPQNVG